MESSSAESLLQYILGDAYEFNSPQPLLTVCVRVEINTCFGCALLSRCMRCKLERRDIGDVAANANITDTTDSADIKQRNDACGCCTTVGKPEGQSKHRRHWCLSHAAVERHECPRLHRFWRLERCSAHVRHDDDSPTVFSNQLHAYV